ncbi:unnamed protein product [Peniophora sp. CBMAI 1063]|nr:unnamed protein product [Peniophora sp. CBMAI 1063]
MKFTLSVVLCTLALSATAAPTGTQTATAATTSSTSVAPSTLVQFQLIDTDLCIAGTGTTVGAQFTLESCGSELTTFDLPGGAPTGPTQLVLNSTISSGEPISCVNARDVAANGAVFLDVCEDDAFERWRVVGGSGTGPIINVGTPADEGTFCLTVATIDAGSPIIFSSCTGGLAQEWVTLIETD